MKALGFVLLVTGSSAFAAVKGYDLKMDLSMDGKHVSSPRMMVKPGETATITQKTENQESFIEVVATETLSKGIAMRFIVGTIGKDGQRVIAARPQLIALENEPAKIMVGDKDGKEVALSVVAKRKVLNETR